MIIYRGRQIEIFDWYSIVTEQLRDGLLVFTINNIRKYKFDKEKFREIDSNFLNYL